MSALARAPRLLRLAVTYLVDLVRANVEVARVVASPTPPEPAIVALDLEVREPWVVASLANMITLTPGTLTLEVAPDASRLYVHVLTTRPLEDHRRHLDILQVRLLEAVT